MKTLTILFAAAAFSLAASEPLVVTHVMHQMSVGVDTKPADALIAVEPNRANGVKALHSPDYLQYYAMPEAAARYDVKVMHSGGIDAMGLLLCNGHLKSQFGPVINAYYQAAKADGHLKIFPDSWSDVTKPEGLNEMYSELYAKYPDVWLKRNGKMVIALMLPRSNVPSYRATVDAMFKGLGGRDKVFLVLYDPVRLQKDNPDWFAEADAFSAWPTQSYGESVRELANFYETARASGKEIWAPVVPSFMQSRYPHENGKFVPNLREKLGVVNFRYDWLEAIRNRAPVVMEITWNDLTEDSAIMPESNHSDAVYELNKLFVDLYKTGKLPAANQEMVFLFHHPQLVENLKLPDGVSAIESFPVSHGKTFGSERYNRTPSTDYLCAVTFLKEPARITLYSGAKALYSYEAKAGLQFQLVYQPRSLNDPQKRYGCNEDLVYPKSEGDLTVTPIKDPLTDSQLYVKVERGDKRLGFFRSHKPLSSAAGCGDMTMTGDCFRLNKLSQ